MSSEIVCDAPSLRESLTPDEAMLRAAFKAGWQARNASPGLKRVTPRTVNNGLLMALGGARFVEHQYVPDERRYNIGIWLRSEFRKALVSARKDGSSQQAVSLATGEQAQ